MSEAVGQERAFFGPPVIISIFQGPIDLLAYLVRAGELDIEEMSVAEVVEQYAAFVRAMEVLNIEEAAEFLPVAAQLVLWKVRSLLPRPQPEAEDEDEAELRRQLEERLAEYRAYKEVAERLAEAHRARQRIFLRSATEEVESGWVELEDVTVFDMVAAMARAIERVERRGPRAILLRPRWSVRRQMSYIIRRLREQEAGQLTLDGMFEEAEDKLWIVVTFLALLELIRRGRVKVKLGEGRQVVLSLAGKAALGPSR